MSFFKAQLFPLSSTVSSRSLPIEGSWNQAGPNSEDSKFLRGWLVYDSEEQENQLCARSARRLALGLILAVGISASFWVGLGLVLARVLK